MEQNSCYRLAFYQLTLLKILPLPTHLPSLLTNLREFLNASIEEFLSGVCRRETNRTKMVLSMLIYVIALIGLIQVLGQTVIETPLEIQLGKEHGITQDASITADTLQKILAGVEAGNKENIYFYGLLKLYGISMVKDVKSAGEQFLRASKLGHAEATTAYGVMKLTGSDADGKRNYAEAVRFFREAVKMNDMVSRVIA